MLSAVREIRQSYYENINAIALYVLILFQLICIKQKKSFPSYCVERIQNFLGRKSHSLVGNLVESNRWYKKVSGKVISFFSIEFWLILETCLLAVYVQYNTSYTVVFGDLVGTGFNYFGLLFICGAMCILSCCILGLNPVKHMDWIAPSYPLALVIGKIACFCSGCCWGIEWEHGVYSYRNERYEVPIQLIESGTALLIFIFLMLYRKKAKKGTLFPIYMIAYSGTRFCSEFLRREDNVLGPFKKYHILCMIGMVVGVILLIIARLLGDKIDAHFNKNYRGVIGVIVKIIRGVNDDGTYTEKGAARVEKINEIIEYVKKKIKAYKKRREIRKRKGRIKF